MGNACAAASVAEAREIALNALVDYALRESDGDLENFTSRRVGPRSAGLRHWHPFVISANLYTVLEELADRFMDEAEFEEEAEEEAGFLVNELEDDDDVQGFKVFFDVEAGGLSGKGSVGL